MGLHRLAQWCSGALVLGACGGTPMHLGETGDDAGASGGTGGSTVSGGTGGSGTGGSSIASGTGGSSISGGTAGSGTGGSSITGGTAGSGTGGSSISGGTGGSSTMGGSAGNNAGGATPVCFPTELPRSQPRLLTPVEYDNTVRDLLGVPPLKTRRLTGYYGESGFVTTNGDGQLFADELAKAAEQVTTAGLTSLDALMSCAAGEDADTCALRFVNEFAARAFRRPVTVDESAALKMRYTAVRDPADVKAGVRSMVAWLLTQPAFVQVESGTPANSGLLEPYAMASRLSYFLTRTMPDPALLAAATAGELQNVVGVAAQAHRLLADPKAHDAIRDFFTQWLRLDLLSDGTIVKDPALYPNFTQLAPDMVTETLMFTEQVVFKGSIWQSLLLNPTTFVNENLGTLYGLPVTGTSFREVSLPAGSQREGLLTQASWLALHSNQVSTSPVHRGLWVRNYLLCQDIPPPPSGINFVIPDTEGTTTRERMQQHTSSPVCSSCHSLMDPIGFGFEHYDAMGQYRAVENGKPIDSTGTLASVSQMASFDDAASLSGALARLSEAGDCIATQLFRFALLRREADGDRCSLASVEGALRAGTFQDALLAIATSDSFRYANW